MARIRLTDRMQSHLFQLIDVQPSSYPPGFALNPLFGFQACSNVEIAVQHEEYRPGNEMHAHHVPVSASISPITLTRGAHLAASDFYRWLTRHKKGEDFTRRTLLLVHFLNLNVSSVVGSAIPQGAQLPGAIGALARVPGRAWVLYDCVPTRYSTGAFDATSGQIMLQELEIQPHKVNQIDLGSLF